MKRLSLLIAMIALVCGNAFAQFSYDFSDGTAGAKIAATYGSPWTTWSGAVGGAEDGVFAELNGNMAAYFTYGNDQVVALGEKTSGVYDIEFDVYIEENYMGYFNIMHHYPCDHDQAIQVYLQAANTGQQGGTTDLTDGTGSVHAAGAEAFELPTYWNDWMHFRIRVDIDNDVAEFYFNGTFMHTWQWSLDSFAAASYSDGTLGGIDFFPPESAANSRFYVDNVVFTEVGADEVVVEDSFEEYTVGNKIASESNAAGHNWWTTWSQAAGGANDGTVSSDYASDGVKSGYITSDTDQVLLLDDREEGAYDFSFDMYTPAGKDGYFNILHKFPVGPTGQNSGDWAMQVYVNAESDAQNSESWHSAGHGTIHAGGAQVADLPCVEDEWMHFLVHIDCDNDMASLYMNDVLYCSWQWSLGSFGDESTTKIAGANFFGPMATSQFYVDNIRFVKLGETFAPAISVNVDEVEMELELDSEDAVEVTIENAGNVTGSWAGWIDFGEGPEGTETMDLFYHNDDPSTVAGIGSSQNCTREIAMRLPASAYGGAAMGMKITSARFYVGSDGFAADYNYTFRVRGQSLNYAPGEILAEKTIFFDDEEQWIEAVFDEPVPMTGQELWVTVGLEQTAGDYPLSMDNGEDYGEESDGNWLSTNGGKFAHCYNNSGNYPITGSWFISATCEGSPIPGTWVSADKEGGYIQDGTSEVVTLNFNTNFLEPGIYSAVYRIVTNDPELPLKEIPITLNATFDAVEEGMTDLYEIYPNPATTSVTLKGENLSHVAIYNVAGQLVRVVKLNNVVNTIDMDVEAGVYFFSIFDNNGANNVQRVVVTK